MSSTRYVECWFLLSCIPHRYSTQSYLDIFQFCAVLENLSPPGSLELLFASFTQFTVAPGNMRCSESYLNREFVFKVQYLSPLTSVLLQVRLKAPTTCVLCQLQFHHLFKETEDNVIKITNTMHRSVELTNQAWDLPRC